MNASLKPAYLLLKISFIFQFNTVNCVVLHSFAVAHKVERDNAWIFWREFYVLNLFINQQCKFYSYREHFSLLVLATYWISVT